MLITLFHFFVITFSMSFESNETFEIFYFSWIKILLILMPIDIFFKLNSGFFHNGASIIDRRLIIKKYYKDEFLYDFFFCLALILNLILWENLEHSPYFSYILVIFFVKYPIFQKLTENFEEIINFNENWEACISLTKLFLKLMFFSHVVACLWYSIGNSSESSWVTGMKIDDKSVSFKYLVSLYWSITTISTTGYGDITPKNEKEYTFSLSVMVLGSLFFGYSLNFMGEVFGKLQKKEINKKCHF